MTKNDLITLIYRQIDVEDLVKKNIATSVLDQSYKDLAQHIYLVLYELPFSKLYYLYSRKQINFYIVGIIIKQRQSKYLEYNKYFKINPQEIPRDYIPIQDEETPQGEETPQDLQNKLDTINKVLYKKYPITSLTAFTHKQTEELFYIELYKLYLKKKYQYNATFTSLSKELKINRNLISDSIQRAKFLIRQEYKNNHQPHDT